MSFTFTEPPDKFANAVVGDKAVICTWSMGRSRDIVTITKVTKTQITTHNEGYERKWRRDSGRLVGGTGYHVPSLLVGTPELLVEVRDENRKKDLVYRLSTQKWETLGLETLKEIEAKLPTKP